MNLRLGRLPKQQQKEAEMTLRRCAVILLCLGVALCFGCGKEKRQKQDEEPQKEGEEFVEEIEEPAESRREEPVKKPAKWFGRFKEKLSGEKAEEEPEPVAPEEAPTDYNNLTALFPETLAGMKRAGMAGERTAVMGMDLSHAEATYTNGEGERVRIEVSDLSRASSSPMVAELYPWMKTDINQRTPSGYQMTTMFGGHRAFESYESGDSTGTLAVFVDGRFVVEAKGTGVKMDFLRAALEEFDIGRLGEIKK